MTKQIRGRVYSTVQSSLQLIQLKTAISLKETSKLNVVFFLQNGQFMRIPYSI